MELWITVVLIIIAVVVWLLNGLKNEETLMKYQEELDKILPLDEKISGKTTSVETRGMYTIVKGIITNTSRKEGWFGDDYRCEYHIEFQDGKSLYLRGSNTDTFLKGSINRIVFYITDNRIDKISYR